MALQVVATKTGGIGGGDPYPGATERRDTRRKGAIDVLIQRERFAAEDGRSRTSTRLRALFVVSRGDGQRYNDLSYAFAGDDSVQVIFDRRRGDRRQQPEGRPVDRRQGSRRSRTIDAELRTLGWAVIRYPR